MRVNKGVAFLLYVVQCDAVSTEGEVGLGHLVLAHADLGSDEVGAASVSHGCPAAAAVTAARNRPKVLARKLRMHQQPHSTPRA